MTHSRRGFLQLGAAGAIGLMPIVTACGRSVDAAFLEATAAGDLPAVERMLAADPELLRATDDAGRSAYALAHLNGHPEVGEHLVAVGYRTDVHEAALAGDWERFSTLTEVDGSVVDEHHPIGGSAMVAAALGGAGADMWRIYAATGHPDRLTGEVTALQAALRYDDLATAELTAATLLGNDADPDLAGPGDLAPLAIADERGSTELVEMLVRLGASTDAYPSIPRTCRSSRTAYDVDGNPYAPPAIDSIPLVERRRFVGQAHGNLDYVRGAVARDPRIAHSVATTGEISVEACAHTGRIAVVDFLLASGAPYSLPTAVVRGDLARAKALLDEDPERIHERGAHDFALAWYPVIGGGNLELMQLLLERGADIEQQHYLGTTALHWAAIRGPIEMVHLLIEHGADVNRRGRKFGAEPMSPLDFARKHEQPEIERLLIDRGARS